MTYSIPPFNSVHVLIVGDVMLDQYWYGPTARISPEAPVPVVHIQQQQHRPGGAANVALNIAALGSQVTLIGVTGIDQAADILINQLSAQGVHCAFLHLAHIATISKLRVLSQNQQLIRLDFEEAFTGLDPQILVTKMQMALAAADIVILSDYGKGTLADVALLIDLARKAGKPVLIDPKGRAFTKYQGATVLTPNLAEFEAVVGACATLEQLVNRGEQLRQHLQLEALLITRSQHGMSLLRSKHPPLHLPAHAREVFDVTGAGDTVIGVLAAALAAEHDLVNATALANLAAGLVVAKLGTATISVTELEHALQLHHDKGIYDSNHLHKQVKAAQAQGETVVMTNGCFDILHAGHVHYLAQARTLGDRLIVAVNDDDSVRRLKGPTRPVTPLAQRMAVLSALEAVDWVVPFSQDTPEQLICQILPDILVKGGDYQIHQVAGHNCVQAHGGRVLILDWVAGCSTTALIAALQANHSERE